MFRVLHERISHNLSVRLLWDSSTDRVRVSVRDRSTGDAFIVVPDPAKALEAFYHPFSFPATSQVVGRLAA